MIKLINLAVLGYSFQSVGFDDKINLSSTNLPPIM